MCSSVNNVSTEVLKTRKDTIVITFPEKIIRGQNEAVNQDAKNLAGHFVMHCYFVTVATIT